jgi:DNA-binding NarL/FixJ family response regulator
MATMTPPRKPRQLVPAPAPGSKAANRKHLDQYPEVKRAPAKRFGGDSHRAAMRSAVAPRAVTPAEGASPRSGGKPHRGEGSKTQAARSAANLSGAPQEETTSPRWDAVVRPTYDALRVWIDDPDPFFRLGVDQFLRRNGVDVVGVSEGFRPRPDLSHVKTILLFHLTENWRELAAGIAENTTTQLVGMAARVDEELVSEALSKGVRGLLLRETLTPQTLLSCLRTVADGNTTVPTGVLDLLLARSRERVQDALETTQLTPRELNVLERLAEGDDTRQVAKRLCYAERTVKNIIHDILLKLHCNTRAHAVALASRQRLI